MKNKFVIITGTNGGIGSALVKVYKNAGYKVIGIDKSISNSNSIVDHFIKIDLISILNSREKSKLFFSKLDKIISTGILDTLVNNAAIQILNPIGKLSLLDFSLTINTNTTIPFYLIKNLYDTLIKSKNASVVNISSIHSNLTKPNFIAYATSKSALSGMTKAMAIEFGKQIRVNSISPAAISTSMLKDGFVGKSELYNKLNKIHPVGRIGEPYEVAELSLFLSSDKAKFINGANFEIDGGISSRLYDPA
jgi:NAD(P)-dependent dehydrogenase (short-subunit alcohol dehydrogenase family)